MYSYKGQTGTGAGSIRAKNIEDHVHATDYATGGEESSCFLNNYCEWSRDWQGTHITNQKVSGICIRVYTCCVYMYCVLCIFALLCVYLRLCILYSVV